MADPRATTTELPAAVLQQHRLRQASVLVGLPYVAGEFDCGHLAVLAAQLLFGRHVKLPGVALAKGTHPTDAREIGAAIALCRREVATRVDVPEPGNLALFTETAADGHTQWHLGTVVACTPERWVLHTREGGASMLQRLADCTRQGLALEGYYAWK